MLSPSPHTRTEINRTLSFLCYLFKACSTIGQDCHFRFAAVLVGQWRRWRTSLKPGLSSPHGNSKKKESTHGLEPTRVCRTTLLSPNLGHRVKDDELLARRILLYDSNSAKTAIWDTLKWDPARMWTLFSFLFPCGRDTPGVSEVRDLSHWNCRLRCKLEIIIQANFS